MDFQRGTNRTDFIKMTKPLLTAGLAAKKGVYERVDVSFSNTLKDGEAQLSVTFFFEDESVGHKGVDFITFYQFFDKAKLQAMIDCAKRMLKVNSPDEYFELKNSVKQF